MKSTLGFATMNVTKFTLSLICVLCVFSFVHCEWTIPKFDFQSKFDQFIPDNVLDVFGVESKYFQK